MSSPQPQETLQLRIAAAYLQAQAFHQPIPLELACYQQQLLMKLADLAGSNAESLALEPLFERLYTTDLYLVIACLQGEENAWQRLQELYQPLIHDTARFICRNPGLAEELAANTLGHLFLADGSGASRLAAYNGRYQLSTWLRTIVARQALNECERPYHRWQRLAELPEIADDHSLRHTEAAIRARQCEPILQRVITAAISQLSERQRFVLLLRYVDAAKVGDIARLLEVTPPTITYYLRQAEKLLRDGIINRLREEYHFDEATIRSFLEELRDNPTYGLAERLRGATEG